jgi:hypothetical protein
MAVVRGPKTPRIEAICSVAGGELRAERPRQRPIIVPTVQLGAMMELPSRGSKATVYSSSSLVLVLEVPEGFEEEEVREEGEG